MVGRMRRWVMVALLASGCGRFGFTDDPALHDGASGGDSDAMRDGSTMQMDAPIDAAGAAVSFGERTGSQHTGVTTDTWLSSTSQAANYGGDDNFSVSPVNVGLLRFDVSAIAPSTPIVAAELHIKTEDFGLASGSVQVFQVLQAWTEGTGQGASGVANYTQRMSATSWANAGAGTPGSRSSTMLAQFVPAAISTDYTVTFNAAGVAMVQSWVDTPSSNAGMAFVVTSGGGNVNFQSREAGANSAPLLVITTQ